MKISVISFFLLNSFLCFYFVNSQTDSCSSILDLSSVVPFNTTSLTCNLVWGSQDIILRYSQSAPSVWSFLLSAPDSNSWVGIGFSTNGKMVGSSAMVGWMARNGTGMIKQYYLAGQTEGLVHPDQGNLMLVDSSLVSLSSRLYLAFQLNTSKPMSKLLYAVGPLNGVPASNGILSQHQDEVSTSFDFTTGQSSIENTYSTLRKSHGLLNMVGWGILLPIGAMVARFLRKWDPIWFYSHSSVQILGFTLGLSGIITGFSLYDKLSADVTTHRALGIIVLVLGSLQVMALLARPDKASKLRRYWNWYHSSVGRALIAVAIGNVFYGIHVGGEGSKWNVGYGVALAILFAIHLVLEVRMYMKK